jgi:hypothetical protein
MYIYYTTPDETGVFKGAQKSLGGYASGKRLPKNSDNALFSDIYIDCKNGSQAFYKCLYVEGDKPVTFSGFSEDEVCKITLCKSDLFDENGVKYTTNISDDTEEPWLDGDFSESLTIDVLPAFVWVRLEVEMDGEEKTNIPVGFKILT